MGKNQFVFRVKGQKRARRISVVEIDRKNSVVYYTAEIEFGDRQPATPSGISIDRFNEFFGVDARDYAPDPEVKAA